MTESYVADIFSNAIYHILITAAPMLLAALIVGLVISIFQATTQIQEQTLSFVPKVLAIFLVLMIAGPWLLRTLMDFTLNLFNDIPNIIK
ncbi:flagellar biosynthesis protein FliQ [Acidaminobacter sp. JC074]|uniref:flagellar biosynthesis protein FliQ n=1 Tax=Acidaminobacter sp. JC074 TaxID=2530199 RepID=UPI001F0F3510|nr:flagellar biosynthesis protein FliQ [Acidaminobacter sp. JC074]MCH4888736.1 flagellar biosynthesis protein FliQ [Acidaminobacter sp. JC074]